MREESPEPGDPFGFVSMELAQPLRLTARPSVEISSGLLLLSVDAQHEKP